MVRTLHLVLALLLIVAQSASASAETDLSQTLSNVDPAILVKLLRSTPIAEDNLPEGFFSWRREYSPNTVESVTIPNEAVLSTAYRFVPPGDSPATPPVPGVATGNKMVQFQMGYIIFPTAPEPKDDLNEVLSALAGADRSVEPLAFEEWGTEGFIAIESSAASTFSILGMVFTGNVVIFAGTMVNTMPATEQLVQTVIDLTAAAVAHLAVVAEDSQGKTDNSHSGEANRVVNERHLTR